MRWPSWWPIKVYRVILEGKFKHDPRTRQAQIYLFDWFGRGVDMGRYSQKCERVRSLFTEVVSITWPKGMTGPCMGGPEYKLPGMVHRAKTTTV